MVNSQNRCSSRRPARTDSPSIHTCLAIALTLAASTGCSSAESPARSVDPAYTSAAVESQPPGSEAKTAANTAAAAPEALCRPSDDGYLRARLQGAIDAELDWSSGVPQCLGAPRPAGDGVRLLFKGPAVDDKSRLLIVIGAGPLAAGESKRNVPANLTVVREGAGEFFATQGDDKCALDEVEQRPLDTTHQRFRLTARGYSTQPARAVRGDGAVLVSRFDVEAIVDYEGTSPPATLAEGGR
jgi:hypothetical protein